MGSSFFLFTILTGVQAGNFRDEYGQYPLESIFAKVEERFIKMYNAAKIWN